MQNAAGTVERGAVWVPELALTFCRRENYRNSIGNRTMTLSHLSSSLSIIPIVLIRLRPAFVRKANEVVYLIIFRCRVSLVFALYIV